MLITTLDCQKMEFKNSLTIKEIFNDPRMNIPPYTIAAKQNYSIKSLNTLIDKDSRITPITIDSIEGKRIYQKSISLVLLKAFYDLYPNKRIKIQHSISKGIYCNVSIGRKIDSEDIKKIKKRMKEIIELDIPFEEKIITKEKALQYFEKINLPDKVKLLKHLSNEKIKLSKLHKIRDISYFPLVISTGVLSIFDLIKYKSGLLLRFPLSSKPFKLPIYEEQKSLFKIFKEDEDWSKILEVANAGGLNDLIASNKISEIIKIAESLHEKKIALIADEIAKRKDKIKFILIAGPSSSGKTTFSKRLSIQLRINNIKTASISTDNYFKSREQTPRHENGDYNFEDIEALDLELLNKHLKMILEGKDILVPKFSFSLGKPEKKGKLKKIDKTMPVIIEGIHCLNEKLTASIPRENKYLIYISALTQINIDDFNRIPTTDNRLLRRIVRDSYFRGYSAYETLNRWLSVRTGEDKNIFPFQERADVMFNSSLIYELAVLKKFALPLLKQVPKTVPEYSEAQRLRNFLMSFLSIDTNEIPPTSILREFVGNSSFKY